MRKTAWVLPLGHSNLPAAGKPCSMSQALPAELFNPSLWYLNREGEELEEDQSVEAISPL